MKIRLEYVDYYNGKGLYKGSIRSNAGLGEERFLLNILLPEQIWDYLLFPETLIFWYDQII